MKKLSDYNTMNSAQQKAVQDLQETKQAIIDCQVRDVYTFWEWLHDDLELSIKKCSNLGVLV